MLTRLRDWSLLLLCSLIWASQFVAYKIIQEQVRPVSATFLTVALSTLFLTPMVWCEQRTANAPSPVLQPCRDRWKFVWIGIFGMALAQLLIVWGVRLSLASNAALLTLTFPVWTAVIAYFVLGESMTRVRWIASALALAGVLQCSGIDWTELNLTSRKFLLGNLLVFLGVGGNSFYNVYSKKLLVRYSPLQILLYSFYAGLAFLLPITLYLEPQVFLSLMHFSAVVWLCLLSLSLLGTCVAMVIFLYVLKRLDAIQAVLSSYLMPFFGVLLAAIVLNEQLTKPMLAGGALVLAGTLLGTVYEDRRRSQAKPAAVPVDG